MKILYNTQKHFTREIMPLVLPKWKKRMEFGFEVLSLQRLESLNANARKISINRKTGETKIYRVTYTQYLKKLFPKMLGFLSFVKEGDKISIDFSDFQGRQVLMFALPWILLRSAFEENIKWR